MGKFLNAEKRHLANWKRETSYLSEEARKPGMYRKRPRDFCLPRACAEENLYPGIRRLALNYSAGFDIQWHRGMGGKCSNHLGSSMVSCVNFLFPFADKPEALGALLRSVFPSLEQVLPMEDSGLYIALEWIGQRNYLGEINRGGKRTRGANFTSADAAVRFSDTSGRIQIALIEWKYGESYGHTSKAEGKSGARRQAIYRDFFEATDSPIDADRVPDYLDLFYEPFYQMMRQQLLAHEMERHRELGAEAVSVVHVCPEANAGFKRITSPSLVPLGDSATDVWKSLLRKPERFVPVHSEDLFRSFDVEAFPELADWYCYMRERYRLQERTLPSGR